MSNLLDYIRWRGDLPLETVAFCEVDGLVLSELSMIFWEKTALGRTEEPASLASLAPELRGEKVSAGFTAEEDEKLLNAAAASRRFGGLTLSDYVSESDQHLEMQFAAVTFFLPDDTVFVSYRGTDSTIVGWKEDFKMAYSRPVPAQASAARYLRRIAAAHGGALRVGGHSKGGNLAMYAAATVEEETRRRIIAVYNNDGPGLSERAGAAALYDNIEDRLFSFVPQSSVVGLLLAHPDRVEVVKSDAGGVWQHNPYTWQVEGGRFLRAPGLTRESVYFESVFGSWLADVSEEELSVLVDTIFAVVSAADVPGFGREFWRSLAKNPGQVMNSIRSVDSETRKQVAKTLSDLASKALRRGEKEKPEP